MISIFRVDNEAKLCLWWGKVIELVLRQIDFGADQNEVTLSLMSFIPSLITFGEDKTSSGILGAIGLGRRSQLSLK